MYKGNYYVTHSYSKYADLDVKNTADLRVKSMAYLVSYAYSKYKLASHILRRMYETLLKWPWFLKSDSFFDFPKNQSSFHTCNCLLIPVKAAIFFSVAFYNFTFFNVIILGRSHIFIGLCFNSFQTHKRTLTDMKSTLWIKLFFRLVVALAKVYKLITYALHFLYSL